MTVSNSLGDVVSQECDVILLGAPVIYTSPANVSVFENTTTTFRVDSAGSGRHYQWLRNGSPIASSDADAYTTPSLTVADSGAVYSVIVYNGAGLVVSATCRADGEVPVPPTVLQQPADASIAGRRSGESLHGLRRNAAVRRADEPLAEQPVDADRRAPVLHDNARALHRNASPSARGQRRAVPSSSRATTEGGYVEAMTRTVTVTVAAPPAITTTTLASRATSGATANNRSGTPQPLGRWQPGRLHQRRHQPRSRDSAILAPTGMCATCPPA